VRRGGEILINLAIIAGAVAIFAMNDHEVRKTQVACAAARSLAQSHRDTMEVDRAGCFVEKVELGPNSF
jgi:hypothetical protein